LEEENHNFLDSTPEKKKELGKKERTFMTNYKIY